jgi:hypothetical protein
MQNLAPLVIPGLLIAFAVYRRVRSHIGRQPLRPTRFKIRIGIFVVVAGAVLVLAHAPLIPALAGLAGGTAVAAFALRLTKFERDAGKVFYTPNLYIGLAVTLLFIGRIAMRLATQVDTIRAAQAGEHLARPDYAATLANPTTVGILMLLVGYYVVYYAGILRTAAKMSAPPPTC